MGRLAMARRSLAPRMLLDDETYSIPAPQFQNKAPGRTALEALSTDVDEKEKILPVRRRVRGSSTFGRENRVSATVGRESSRDMQLEEQAQEAAKSAAIGNRYDPSEAEQYFKLRTLDVWKRDMQISVPFTTFLGQVLVDWQRGVEKENRRKRAKDFMEIIASLGPAFIKAGQALSSRPDLLPPEYLQELQKLQDRLPPFPNDVAFKIIEEELKLPMSEVFEKVEPTPVAAASIGQVYKGYLKSGEAVAIKVQRPECEKVIALDIYILRQLSGTLSQMIRLLRRDIDLQSVVEEFGKLIYEEIDYLQEARNAERFAELYGSDPDVYVPRIYWRFSRRKLLVMEWVEGQRLTSTTIPKEQKTRLVRSMVQCSLQQMLDKGFFHADPHGGNLLCTPDGRLCYLDFGMMSEVEQFQRYGILEAVIHMVNRDWTQLCQLYVRLGFIPAGTDLTPIIKALDKALPDVLGASVDTFNIKNVIGELGDIMYKFPFKLPPYYTAIVRCLGVLEGLAIQVDGQFKIINNAYPYIASRVLTDPQLQNSLEFMVFTSEKRLRWRRFENLLESASEFGDWDVGLAGNIFIDYVFSDERGEIRANIADDITDFLDTVGLDTVDYLRLSSMQLAPALPLAALPALPRSGDSSSQQSPSDPPQPSKAMEDVLKAFEILTASPSVASIARDPERLLPMLRELASKLAGKPLAQRFVLEVASHVMERISTRAIRLAFRMPQPPAKQLPRLKLDQNHKRGAR